MHGSDGSLVSRVLTGDAGAFNVLAHRWQKPLYNFVYRYTGHVEEAEDVCQEAFTRAFAQIDRLREPDRFGSWLHAIAYRLCQDRGRRRSRRIELSTEAMAEVGVDPTTLIEERGDAGDGHHDDPAGLAEVNELGELLRRALQRLPEEQRVAIVLREYQGYTAAEIGRLLDVPIATVRSRIFYGLKGLRRMFAHSPLSQELLNR